MFNFVLDAEDLFYLLQKSQQPFQLKELFKCFRFGFNVLPWNPTRNEETLRIDYEWPFVIISMSECQNT